MLAQMSFTDREQCQGLLATIPLFSLLSPEDLQVLTTYMEKIVKSPNSIVVNEGEIIDKLYFVAEGKADITRQHVTLEEQRTIHVGTLTVSNTIGLSKTDFFSTTALRTATITAETPMVLYAIDLFNLQYFLNTTAQQYPALRESGEKLLLLRILKSQNLFSKLPIDKTQQLIKKIRKVIFPSQFVIFEKNTPADRCYILLTGKVTIRQDKETPPIATLRSGALFGEGGLMPNGTRNASAYAEEDCELFELTQHDFLEIEGIDTHFQASYKNLRLQQCHPQQSSQVAVTTHTTNEKETMTVLTTTLNGEEEYLQLSPHELVIWQALNGTQSLKMIAQDLAKTLPLTADNMTAWIIKAATLGFVLLPGIDIAALGNPPSFWKKLWSSLFGSRE